MNETACQFIVTPEDRTGHRLPGPLRCRLKRNALGATVEAPCGIGAARYCPWPELRESEIRRLERANRASQRPTSMLVKLARRGR